MSSPFPGGKASDPATIAPTARPASDSDSDTDGDADDHIPLVPAVLRYPVVQIAWSATDRIQQISVGERPSKPFPGTDGSHTTAWVVFVDTVRRRLVGRTRVEARAALTALIDAIDIPAERLLLDATRRRKFDTAAGETRAHLHRAGNSPSDTPRHDLALAIGAYLTCRNFAPLANVRTDGRATGAGERPAAGHLRTYESTGLGATAEQLRTWIWELIDDRPISYLLGDRGAIPTPERVPGLGTGLAANHTAIQQMFVRHLREISRAYPLAYRISNLHQAATFNPMMADTVLPAGLTMPAPPPAADLPPAAAVTGPNAPQIMPIGWGTTVHTPTISLILRVAQNQDVLIAGVAVAGRSPTLYDGQQHHLTSQGALVRSIQSVLVGQSIPGAVVELIRLAEDLERLPTCPAGADGQPALSARDDPTGRFNATYAAFLTAREAASLVDEGSADLQVCAICHLASHYLRVRNVLPLAVIPHGSLALNKNEQRALDVLRRSEPAPARADAGSVCGALWALLDLDQLTHVVENDRQYWRGASPDWLPRLIAALVTHRETIATAWPQSYEMSGWLTTASLDYALKMAGLRLDPQARAIVIKALGFGTGAVAPTTTYKTTELDHDQDFNYDSALADLLDEDEYERVQAQEKLERKRTEDEPPVGKGGIKRKPPGNGRS